MVMSFNDHYRMYAPCCLGKVSTSRRPSNNPLQMSFLRCRQDKIILTSRDGC